MPGNINKGLLNSSETEAFVLFSNHQEHDFEEKVGLLHEMFQEKRPMEHYQSLLIQLKGRITSHFELVSLCVTFLMVYQSVRGTKKSH